MKFLIKRINLLYNYENLPYFSAFVVEKITGGEFGNEYVCGDVDPFVDGNFEGSEELCKLPAPELIIWAKQQIGKTLECEDLYFKAFATKGKVKIS